MGVQMHQDRSCEGLSTHLHEDSLWRHAISQKTRMHLWCRPMLSRYSRDPLPSQMLTPFCFSTPASVLPLMNHSNSSATPAHQQGSCFNMPLDELQTGLPGKLCTGALQMPPISETVDMCCRATRLTSPEGPLCGEQREGMPQVVAH